MKRYAILLITALLGRVALAQDDGFLLSDSTYDTLEEGLLFGDGRDADGSARRAVSLRPYCPAPGQQGVAPAVASLGWAFGYGAMSVAMAEKRGLKGPRVTAEAFSAYFPFDLMKKDPKRCRLTTDYVAELKRIFTQVGNVKAAEYDRRPFRCDATPPAALLRRASPHAVRELQRVFRSNGTDRSSSVGEKVFKTKQVLRAGRPVVVTLLADPAFATLRTDTWLPDESPKLTGQAVLVVGYDDDRQAFEVLNSRGTAWGHGGFAWVRYRDMQYARHGFQLLTGQVPSPHPGVKPLVRFGGDFGLYSPDFPDLTVTLRQRVYETNQVWAEGSRLQLVADRVSPYHYVYVFSLDPTGKPTLHFPLPGPSRTSPLVADERTRVVMPAPRLDFADDGTATPVEQAMIKDQPGTDWVVALYSTRRLEAELPALFAALTGHQADLLPALEKALGNRLVPWANVRYAPDRMRFQAESPIGSVVPVVLRLRGRE